MHQPTLDMYHVSAPYHLIHHIQLHCTGPAPTSYIYIKSSQLKKYSISNQLRIRQICDPRWSVHGTSSLVNQWCDNSRSPDRSEVPGTSPTPVLRVKKKKKPTDLSLWKSLLVLSTQYDLFIPLYSFSYTHLLLIYFDSVSYSPQFSSRFP